MIKAVVIVGLAVTLRLRMEATLIVRAKTIHIQYGDGGHVEAARAEVVLKGVEPMSSVGFEWAPPAPSNPSYPVIFGPWAPAACWCVQGPGPQLLPRHSLPRRAHSQPLCDGKASAASPQGPGKVQGGRRQRTPHR